MIAWKAVFMIISCDQSDSDGDPWTTGALEATGTHLRSGWLAPCWRTDSCWSLEVRCGRRFRRLRRSHAGRTNTRLQASSCLPPGSRSLCVSVSVSVSSDASNEPNVQDARVAVAAPAAAARKIQLDILMSCSLCLPLTPLRLHFI